MKTVKTVNGIKKIEDWNDTLVPFQLRTILQEHRATLVNKLIDGGLDIYIHYKFSTKAEPHQIEQIKETLSTLKHSGIDSETYAPIFSTVLQHEFTSLDNTLFYHEIDKTIKLTLFQPRLFNDEGQQHFFQ